jgi:hypothetical protein
MKEGEQFEKSFFSLAIVQKNHSKKPGCTRGCSFCVADAFKAIAVLLLPSSTKERAVIRISASSNLSNLRLVPRWLEEVCNARHFFSHLLISVVSLFLTSWMRAEMLFVWPWLVYFS